MINKYFKIYNQIVDKAINENRSRGDVYYENHHIIPSSIGGNNSDSNLVLLTAREHYLCHYLLTKFTEGQQFWKMVKAFDAMGMKGKGQTEDRAFILNSKLFQKNRILAAEAHSIMMTGKKQKPEHIEARRKANTGKKRSPEAIENYKNSTVFKTMKFEGHDNWKVKVIDFFDSNGKLMFTSKDGIGNFIKDNNLPKSAFVNSYQNNGKPLYDTIRSLCQVSKNNLKYKGWNAKIRA